MKIVRSCLGRQAAVGINTNSNLIKVDSSAAIVSSVFYFARGVGGSSCYGGITVAGVSHLSGTFHLHHQQHESTSSPFMRPISSEHSVLFSTFLALSWCLGFSGIVWNFNKGFVFSFFACSSFSHRRDNFRYSGGQNDYNP